MPAKEDTYRSQRALHIVFAVSSIAMFASITWMIIADHFREWKNVQRDFVKFDAAKAQKDAELASEEQLAQLEKDLATEREKVADAVHNARATIKEHQGKAQKKEQQLSFLRAKRDSEISFLDIEKDKRNEGAVRDLEARLKELDAKIEQVRRESEAENDTIKEANEAIDDANTKSSEVTKKEKDLANKKKEIERIKQKQWTIWSAMRSSPILDAFQSAVKIEQLVLSDLPIHYSFKGVPRFDRCTTCHKGIDSVTKDGDAAFDADTIKDLSPSPYREAFRTHSHPELFAGPKSPHPREKFGCSICHLGQGSGTTFVYASHTPNDAKKLEEWKEQYGWQEIHHWPWKMSKTRFTGSGCLKCHPHVVDLDSPKTAESPAAQKVLKGYNIVRQYGCFGCHEINGWKNAMLIGPDLRLEPQTDEEKKKAVADPMNPPGRMRKVGPSLRRIVEKVPEDWTARWIKLPKGFRPSTRMPQFYGLTNNDGSVAGTSAEDLARSAVEIRAISHYLFAKSADYLADAQRISGLSEAEFQERVQQRNALEQKLADKNVKLSDSGKRQLIAELDALRYEVSLRDVRPLSEPPVAVNPQDAEQAKRGRDRFIERGCLACHSHKGVGTDQYPQAKQDFGPDLSNVSVKLKDKDGKPNTRWLFNWLKDPLVYHSTSFMPNLQLKDEEAADIAAWLLSVEGGWANDPGPPALDDNVLNELITLFLQKSFTLKDTKTVLASGLNGLKPERVADVRGDERMLIVADGEDLKEKKLTYLGKKTISRMGCFGCHDIPGFETAKPIGTELASWGVKARMDPDKLDFAHIVEYLDSPPFEKEHHNADFEMFLEGMKHHKGESFLWQKLRDPRSYDFDKLKAWDDKLRMPRFPFADDPEAVEAVMTFVLGLVADDQIPQHYRNVPKAGSKFARIEGDKALTKFNCRGCHITKMPEFTFDLGKVELPDPSAQHGSDFPDTARDQAAMPQFPQPKVGKLEVGKLATISAMHVATDEATDEMAFDIWVPTVIADKQFFIGDRIVMPSDAIDKSKSRNAEGGQFAELLVSHLMKTMNKTLPSEVWGFVPPPLVREGMKAQPAWLHQFLLNPSEIRPAVRLRMPRFNMTSDEAASLAGYFAAVDGMEYPYEHVRDRDDVYLSQKETQHPNYLRDGWQLLTMVPDAKSGVTDKLCASCHNVGNRLAGGEPEGRGPNLYLTPDRLRSDWLRQWIITPKRILPYTAMPNNFALTPQRYQEQFPGTSHEQIIGVRDALMNYQKVQASELATQAQAQPSTGGN